MKTVVMTRDYDYRPRSGVIIVYKGGRTYERVPEAAARGIRAAKAGEFVKVENDQPVS